MSNTNLHPITHGLATGLQLGFAGPTAMVGNISYYLCQKCGLERAGSGVGKGALMLLVPVAWMVGLSIVTVPLGITLMLPGAFFGTLYGTARWVNQLIRPTHPPVDDANV